MTVEEIDTKKALEIMEGEVEGRVLINFGRKEGCYYCQMLEPTMELLSEQTEGMEFTSLDIMDDLEAGKLLVDLGIRGVPTLVVFEDGQEIGRKYGYGTRDVISEFIEGLDED